MAVTDNLNCIKNLIQLMCCDGKVYPREKAFLLRAAAELDVQVDDWNGLLKEVIQDNASLYPLQNRDRAVAVLKSLIIMSKADGRVDAKEKALTVRFAKSIGVNKSEWKQILKDIDLETLFDPFTETTGAVTAIRDDFEKLDAFLQVAEENGASTKTVGLREFLDDGSGETIVCFHAAEDKDETVTRCQMLLEKCGGKLVCILTRYQGHQVKYLLEIGLKKCIIEPVYARDIVGLFKR
ncbi:MAG: tellurite resistance TerB family protein [Planctomycetota bacterium]|jgi:uncharacterized tellurite resistance protein B-like protein